MKKILYLLIALLPLGLNADKMKVPFSVEVDFSKKGTVFETDFQAPWNMWGSWVMFGFGISGKYGHYGTAKDILNYSLKFGSKYEEPIAKEEQQYFKLKVTLTPLGWASNNITISTIDYSKESWKKYKERYKWVYDKEIWQKKEYKDGEKIEFIISIPLYGGQSISYGYGGKMIMLADLQRLRKYHIKVESLENVELPIGVKTGFHINRHSRKH